MNAGSQGQIVKKKGLGEVSNYEEEFRGFVGDFKPRENVEKV